MSNQNNNLKVLIDTIPFIPDVYTINNPFLTAENTNPETSIPLHNTIFIFSLNYVQYDPANDLNIYNNPYYMFYGASYPGTTYYLPPIKFFTTKIATDLYGNDSNYIKIINSLMASNFYINILYYFINK
jgi:hypothetical protein